MRLRGGRPGPAAVTLVRTDSARDTPSLSRRAFVGAALAAPTAAWLVSCAESEPEEAGSAPQEGPLRSWSDVRAQFELDPGVNHLSAFILAPHSRPVRNAIATHRAGLDRDPHGYLLANQDRVRAVARAAAAYLETSSGSVALTDSTTMGLGVLIGGMRFAPGDEILMTEHEHFVADQTARYAAERTGATVNKVALYPPEAPEQATVDGIVGAIRDAIGPQTRLVLVTWVHSATGVRLPLPEIAEVVAAANAGRATEQRALLVVDGAHGFGAGPAAVEKLGCDGLASGCHKWLLGPRGTGVAWGSPELWERVTPVIPTLDDRALVPWIEGEPATAPPGVVFSPGGYHSFEHRWALEEAFDLHARVGARRIARRIDDLGGQLRDGLGGAPHVTLHAPEDERLHSGVVTFTVDGIDRFDVVDRLLDEHRVSATVTPYPVSYARLGACWLNTEDEIEAAIGAVREL